MAKNRYRQKDNRKKYKQEERLNAVNQFNVKDATPMLAVDNLIHEARKEKKNEKQ